MVIQAEVKRKVVADWTQAFPELTKVGERRLLRVVGPLLVGIEIVTGPQDSYRSYNVAYPLWRNDLKECLDYPEVLYEFVGEQGRQMFIRYDQHDMLFRKAVQSVEQDALFQFCGNISLSSLMKSIDKYERTALIKAQGFLARARLLRFRCLCSLYVDRIDIVKYLLSTISAEKNQWDMERFIALYGDFDRWFNSLVDLAESDGRLQQIVEMNLKEPKLARLTRASLNPD